MHPYYKKCNAHAPAHYSSRCIQKYRPTFNGAGGSNQWTTSALTLPHLCSIESLSYSGTWDLSSIHSSL